MKSLGGDLKNIIAKIPKGVLIVFPSKNKMHAFVKI